MRNSIINKLLNSFHLYIIMWRAKITTLKTSNLCNEFLITYLTKKKNQCDKLGMEKKGYVYNTAITSIKKYPLPIISPKQLKLLYGVGDLLCQELTIVIKNHYKQYLKKKNTKQIEILNEKPSQNLQQHIQDNQESINRANSLTLQRIPPSSKQIQSQQIEDDQKSNYSVKSAVYNKSYKPRPNTQASFIMIILKKHGTQDYMGIENIRQNLKAENNQNIAKKMLNLTLNNLAKSQYLIFDPFDSNYVKITPKGIIQCDALQIKNKVKQSQLKVKSFVSSFLSNASHVFVQKVETRYMKRIVQYQQSKELILLIDNREIKDKQEQNFFQLKLKQKYGIKCLTRNLPLGDFLWMYDGQILDYIVQRKTADDLVSSIFDGRYHQQKERLKNSNITNIYYLYEGHLTGSFAKNQKQASSALLHTRVQDKFKVVQVNSISQSIKFIHYLTDTLFKKLSKERKLESHGSLEEFQSNCGKNSNMTVEQIFGLSLKTIPGVGRNSVEALLKYFKSFKCMYNELKKLQNQEERVQFLKQVFKGCGISKNIPELLVKLFF